ncbi:MAG: hypothetical protein AAGG08_18670, partial [Actinomycetota bacterium]
HHLTEWQHGGRTAEDTCVLLCHHHHATLHLPGWRVTGDAHRFQIHRPDGTTETSTPPAPIEPSTPDPTSGAPPPHGDPPGWSPPRADAIGRETTAADVQATLQHVVRQLELV